MLPDGTLVVPLADEDDERNTIEEEDEDDDSTIASPPPPLPTYNRRHLVNNYRKRPLRQARSLMSDDGTTSVVSLSDKYRQQDEVEVFEEFYPVPVVAKTDSIPINSTKAAAEAAKNAKGSLDSPKTQSTVASEDR